MTFVTTKPREGAAFTPRGPMQGVSFQFTKDDSHRISLGVIPQAALGLKRGDRVEVAIGEGADIGRIRISKSTNGTGFSLSGNKASHGGAALCISCRAISRVIKRGATPAYVIDGNALYVTVIPPKE